MSELSVVPVTADRLDELADLFDSNSSTRGCWCMSFVVPQGSGAARYGRWRGGNRSEFEALAVEADPPMGLLALSDGTPIGWCATGPRSRYQVAISPRATVMNGRDPAEDELVWFVPCFFVRVGYRRSGVTAVLLETAVSLAEASGARAIEGWPIADSYGGVSFEGRESLFAQCGFTCVARPSPRRAVMRRDL